MSSLADAWRALLRRTGVADDPSALRLARIPGGRNNRVFEIEGASRALVMKEYFRDSRNRLAAEWAFCRYAWEGGIDAVPEPVAADRDEGIAVFAQLPGRRISPSELGRDEVAQAAEFAAALQRDRSRADLPEAAEACFSIDEHLALIDARVSRLRASYDPEVGDFATELAAVWAEIGARLRERGDRKVPQERHVSPSDFGFHNALVDEARRVRFHDFEYAGWDDAAKLICDFFCQPEVPVPLEHFDLLASGPLADAAERAAALLDAYRVKWCCIVLNEFLPTGAERRRYALGSAEEAERRSTQLEKARRLLAAVSG